MDLIQRKLTKSEWEGIEVPVSDDEKEILKLIKNGYNDVNIRYNNNPSLIGYMKIDVSDNMELTKKGTEIFFGISAFGGGVLGSISTSTAKKYGQWKN